MEIREFAERVLYSATLTEKLAVPGRLSDRHPGARCHATPLPARPKGLEFSPPERARATFPKPSALHDPEARGRALHFFANRAFQRSCPHATQLMPTQMTKHTPPMHSATMPAVRSVSL